MCGVSAVAPEKLGYVVFGLHFSLCRESKCCKRTLAPRNATPHGALQLCHGSIPLTIPFDPRLPRLGSSVPAPQHPLEFGRSLCLLLKLLAALRTNDFLLRHCFLQHVQFRPFSCLALVLTAHLSDFRAVPPSLEFLEV
jgi:hypothetical protein